MTRSIPFAVAFFCTSAAAFAQASASGLRPSEPAASVAAAQSCRDAITPERLDVEQLSRGGWYQAAESPLRLFAREGVILLSNPQGSGCVVTARIAQPATYQMVMEAMVSAFGRASRASPNGEVIWMLPGNRAMQADVTGDRERPAVRIVIIYVTPGQTGQ